MESTYCFNDYELNLARRELRCSGELLELQPKVFAVLALLVSNAGVVLTKEDFLERVWSGRFVTENVLSRCVRELRRILEDDASEPRYIRTIRGLGYEFVASLSEGDSNGNSSTRVRTVAVLPFLPLLSAQSNPALEMGLVDSLITDLSQLGELVVRPLSSVLDAAARHPTQDNLELGLSLDVDVIIEGRLQIAEKRVRLNLRAIYVKDGSALLAERFEEPIQALFSLQDQLCEKIIGSLALQLSAQEFGVRIQRSTRNVDAYYAYINGRLKLINHQVEGANAALVDFEQALRLDSDYAEALVGIAEVHELLGSQGTRPHYHYKKMRSAAEHAIRVAPEMARAYACLGIVAWQYDWNWAEAERLLRRSTSLDHSNAENLIALSDFLAFQSRYKEALEVAERAGEINPFSPWIQALITQALYMGRHFEEAVEQGRRSVELAPTMGFNQFFLGLALAHLQKYDEAIERLQQAITNSGRKDFYGALGYVLASAGDRKAAIEMLKQMDRASEEGTPVPPIAKALIYAGLNDEKAALKELQKCVEQHSWHILILHADPSLEKLRTRPESLALLRECNVK
jgi:DNA-binding winged helix-turn-helix (wHTH) protein/tetratricopeptide (TPR) repeat protein